MLERAREAGVTRILVPGWDVPSSEAAVSLCRRPSDRGDLSGRSASRLPELVAAVGIHPHAARDVDGAGWSTLEALARDPAVVAIGETGLDYDRLFSPREAQLAALRRHLALAMEVAKPLLLHCRSSSGRSDAQEELLGELEQSGVGVPRSDVTSAQGPVAVVGGLPATFGPRPRAILHSFSGTPAYAERALAMGLALSFSGLVFRPGEATSAVAARLVPPEGLLVETDSPYLAPPTAPRRRNEPSFVTITASWLAERRDEDAADVARRLDATFDRIFGLNGART